MRLAILTATICLSIGPAGANDTKPFPVLGISIGMPKDEAMRVLAKEGLEPELTEVEMPTMSGQSATQTSILAGEELDEQTVGTSVIVHLTPVSEMVGYIAVTTQVALNEEAVFHRMVEERRDHYGSPGEKVEAWGNYYFSWQYDVSGRALLAEELRCNSGALTPVSSVLELDSMYDKACMINHALHRSHNSEVLKLVDYVDSPSFTYDTVADQLGQ